MSPSITTGTASGSPLLNQPTTPLSPNRPTTATSVSSNAPANGFGTSDSNQGTGGVVRRKPARRANTAERRATHNAVERQRRETLNGRFLDLAALLPNLASVRRPSKSAIVNSSIALVRTQRRFRALAARELRILSAEADALRREVNEWRASHPDSQVNAGNKGPVEEPARSADFIALMELEDIPAEEMEMNEAERIAYEMRGGDAGMVFNEDGEAEDAEDDFIDSRPSSAPTQQTASQNRARGQSFNHQQQQQSVAHAQQQHQQQHQHHQQQQQQQHQLGQQAIAQHHASLVPPYQQQHQLAQHHQQMLHPQLGFPSLGAPTAAPFGMPTSFDALAAAGFPPTAPLPEVDAAKLAAWNAHIYSALAAQQQQQMHQQQQSHHHQQQQQWAAAMQFQTPPNSSQGPVGMFGQGQVQNGAAGQQALLAHFQRATSMHNLFGSGANGHVDEDGMSSSDGSSSPPRQSYFPNGEMIKGSPTPGSVSGASTSSASGAPSLSLSLSSLSNASSSSLASSITSPIHINMGPDPFSGAVSSFPFPPPGTSSSAPTSASSGGTTPGGLSGMHTPGVSVTVGGGGGGHPNYAAMSMFI